MKLTDTVEVAIACRDHGGDIIACMLTLDWGMRTLEAITKASDAFPQYREASDIYVHMSYDCARFAARKAAQFLDSLTPERTYAHERTRSPEPTAR